MIKHILTLLAKTLAIAAGIGTVVSLAGRFFGWQEAVQFANGLYIAGIVLIGIGLLTVSGGMAQRGDFKIRYAETAGQQTLMERNQRWWNDTLQGYSMLITFCLIGGFLILAGVLVETLGK
ncbi:MAG: hypothetical protein GYA20_09825 [Chloroflexi bacterium]|nr:hypothetical protein [Chloroflexota bacterium]